LLADLESCVVDLLSPSKETPSHTINALHARGLKKVILISSYLDGSVLLHDCEECFLILACQQVSLLKAYPSRGQVVYKNSFSPSSACIHPRIHPFSYTSARVQ